jgi:beta-galactosidase/beta-glucuronidase
MKPAMNHLTVVLAALFTLPLVPPAGAAEWKPAAGPLKTRWAKDVSPDKVLPEYPRPQMVRKDWMNLNGLWDVKLSDGTATRILVPFAVESALSGVMKYSDKLSYRRSFEVPKDWNGMRVLLHFGAVDWETKVSLNGKELGTHRGGYDAFSFDITDALKKDGAQELTVNVFDATDLAGEPRGKQTLTPKGIKYTPTTGIWQTVWLEPVSPTHIKSLEMVADVDAQCLRLKVNGSDKAGDAAMVEAVASDGGKEIARVSGEIGADIKLAIPDPKLWSPDTPHLYDLKVSLKSKEAAGSSVADSVSSYFGMRKIALGKDENGVTRIMLNGKPVFQVGPLDQGFWPDGIYTAPTDEALKFDVTQTKRLGFNCTRKHVKVEPDRWYYWCDKVGLLVWQDMPSINSYAKVKQPIDAPQFKIELTQMVRQKSNHPSIIMWVVFNEYQGIHDTQALTAHVKALDPSRLVNACSGEHAEKVGETVIKCGDVYDQHTYPGPSSPKPEADRAAVLGEFGGLGLAIDGHHWAQRTWGYKGMKNVEELTTRYEELLARAWELNASEGLSAVIYTQITDVETECNGLLTYDREINKVIPERAALANTGKK